MPIDNFHIYLASGSPRRAELLEQIGVHYRQMNVEVDERVNPGETPQEYVERLALAKAQVGRAGLSSGDSHPVLGADTAVVVDGEIFGKPLDREHALKMLARLSGRCHEVYSAVALVGHLSDVRCNISKVCFRSLTAAEILAYWESGEPVDKAGGYAIQGLGAIFVERLEGSYSGVMGLPVFETRSLLLGEGIDMLECIKNTKGTGA
jgi:septum formation protein